MSVSNVNTGSGTFSINGVLSGLNTSSIVSQLIQADSGPLNALQAQNTADQNKLQQYQVLNTQVLGLQVAAEAFTTGNAFGATTATSSNSTDLAVTAGSGAVTGTYQVTVNQLAQGSQVLSQGYSPGTEIGTGSITLTLGAGSLAPITVDGTNNTLQGLASAINNAHQGVQAAVVSDGSNEPEHLILTSVGTGSAQAISVTTNLSGAASGTTPLAFNTLQQAQNAVITLGTGDHALTINSQTNTVTGAIPGVTLSLQSSESQTASTVTVQADTSSMQGAISTFISSFNTLNSFFGSALSYDPATSSAGALLGDNTATTIQNQLNNILATGSGTALHSLAAIGITQNSTGNLTISDQSALTNALQNHLSDVKDLFSNADTGVATQTNAYVQTITTPGKGMLDLQQSFIQADMAQLVSGISSQQTLLANEQKALTQEFTNMETLLSQLTTQNAAVASLGLLGGSSSSNSSNSSSNNSNNS